MVATLQAVPSPRPGSGVTAAPAVTLSISESLIWVAERVGEFAGWFCLRSFATTVVEAAARMASTNVIHISPPNKRRDCRTRLFAGAMVTKMAQLNDSQQ
jgi:hypothetical protein